MKIRFSRLSETLPPISPPRNLHSFSYTLYFCLSCSSFLLVFSYLHSLLNCFINCQEFVTSGVSPYYIALQNVISSCQTVNLFFLLNSWWRSAVWSRGVDLSDNWLETVASCDKFFSVPSCWWTLKGWMIVACLKYDSVACLKYDSVACLKYDSVACLKYDSVACLKYDSVACLRYDSVACLTYDSVACLKYDFVACLKYDSVACLTYDSVACLKYDFVACLKYDSVACLKYDSVACLMYYTVACS